MVEILDPKDGESIYDPACGTGGMLLGAIEHVQRAGGDPRTFFGKIYGQEKNLTTSSIARMNLVLHGIEDFQIVREDTLRNPAFTDSSTGGLATFDCVIANPPFSLKEWGRDVWEADPWGRAAVRPAARELRRLRLGAAHGRVDGGAAPAAWRSCCRRARCSGRTPRAASGRRCSKQDLIEAVIGLAPNLFYGTGLAPARRRPPPDEAGRAEGQGADRRRVEPLPQGPRPELPRPRARRRRSSLGPRLRGCAGPREGRRLSTRSRPKDWTLNISRYVLPPIGEDIPPLPEAVAAFKQALADARAAEDRPARGPDRRRLALVSKAPSISASRSSSRTSGARPTSCAG